MAKPKISSSKMNANLSQLEVSMYGDALWIQTVKDVCLGKMENTWDTALEFGADLSKLPVEGMYFAQSKFIDKVTGEPTIQIVLLVEKGTKKSYYASILRDKNGEQLVSDTDEYAIHEVRAAHAFTVPNAFKEDGSPVIISEGDHYLKAYAI